MPCAKAALRALSWSVPPCCRALRCLEAASGSEPLLRVQILGVDFTKSNEWTGKRSFGGRSLHDTSFSTNPYREAIKVIGKTLEVFDDDRLIPAYGFGTAETGADKLVSFNPEERPCHAFQEVEQRYLQLAQCLHFVSVRSCLLRRARQLTCCLPLHRLDPPPLPPSSVRRVKSRPSLVGSTMSSSSSLMAR